MNKGCYHCAEPILTGDRFQLEILGSKRQMCCAGCQAIAQTILDNGLISYYQYRSSSAEKSPIIPEKLQALSLYDNQEIQQDFVQEHDNYKEIILSINGITCAACAWLIENQLSQSKGVFSILVNITTHRATLQWDPNVVKLSQLLHQIKKIGYDAAPFEINHQEQKYQQEMKRYLYRIGVAGLATMQVMMLAIALYFDVLGNMDLVIRDYFRWVSLLFATPVLFYSASPFYHNAYKSIKAGQLGMDVPVSIALLLSYFASFYATLTGTGQVYFESIAMFTFFLLIGRFLEMRAKRTAAAAGANLLTLIPRLATLANKQKVPVNSLCINDDILVLPGETFPADGHIIYGQTTIDESMLTGESMPVTRIVGDCVYAGTQNGDGNVTVRVSAQKKDSLVSQIIRLQEAAQQTKPKVAQIAQLITPYFVVTILLIAAVTWCYWHFIAPENAFWILLSVLVATCPCALSLATPMAITCATSSFNRLGLLLRSDHVIETLTKINHVVMDKTGTLTKGKMTLSNIAIFNDMSLPQVMAIASALESYANHPIANAFKKIEPEALVNNVENVIGQGLKGQYKEKEWKIGRASFALSPFVITNKDHQYIWLSEQGNKVASFLVKDQLRPSSLFFIDYLKKAEINITMLTGDNHDNAQQIAKQLGITDVIAGVSPQGKLDFLNALSAQNITMMMGDGINDTPVLAKAHLSVAMGGGTDGAKSCADIILMGDSLTKLINARQLAFFTQKIIWQNMAWALGYNLIILPLAVMGHLAPYLAVIGMSASSIIVVSNSLRLLRTQSVQEH